LTLFHITGEEAKELLKKITVSNTLRLRKKTSNKKYNFDCYGKHIRQTYSV